MLKAVAVKPQRTKREDQGPLSFSRIHQQVVLGVGYILSGASMATEVLHFTLFFFLSRIIHTCATLIPVVTQELILSLDLHYGCCNVQLMVVRSLGRHELAPLSGDFFYLFYFLLYITCWLEA